MCKMRVPPLNTAFLLFLGRHCKHGDIGSVASELVTQRCDCITDRGSVDQQGRR